MGQKDTITKDYMKDNAVFADVFNHLMYEGECVIKPENLHSLDTVETVVSQEENGKIVPLQRLRDEYKGLALMEDGETIYLLLGIENQSEIHYAMPVKNMIYDAMEYAGQVDETSKKHRKERADSTYGKSISSGEFLSGFYKSDVLVPVVTLVVYFGADQWDAPRSLHEMFDEENQEVLKYVPDYKINLIVPAEMTDEEIDCFKTDFREVMLYIKYSKDKKHLNKIVFEDERFKKMDLKAARVISKITGIKYEIEKGDESVSMCQALEELREDARIEGRAEGRAEERVVGIKALIKVAQEYFIPKEQLVKRVRESFNLSEEEAEHYVSMYTEH